MVAQRTATADSSNNARQERQLVVGAVADGGGSRVLSHIGARLAANLAASLMTARWEAEGFCSASEADLESFWRALFTDCRNAIAHEAKLRSPPLGPAISPGDLACTLITFMATPERLAAAQVGDGFLVFSRQTAVSDDDEGHELMFRNRDTEEAGQVVWITASNWADDFRHGVRTGPLEMVLASTDGIENVVLAAKAQAPGELVPHQRFFAALLKLMRKASVKPGERAGAPDADLDRRLEKILSDPVFDEHVDDDKSMALAFLPAEGHALDASETSPNA